MADPEEGRRPILFYGILVLAALYVGIRLIEGGVCLSDWLFDWGTCSW